MMRKWIDRAFVVLFFLALFSGFVRTALFPKDINYYENRYANKLPEISLSGFLDRSLQEGVDDALMDQIPLAQSGKKLFNGLSARVKAVLTGAAMKVIPANEYINLGNILVYGGVHYVYSPLSYEVSADNFERRIDNINRLIDGLPDTRFSVYYIEKETDLDLRSGEKKQIGDRILSQIGLPEQRKGIYRVDSFAQFDETFFRTDTHWNHKGAYRGYCELLALVMPEETPLPHGEEGLVCQRFSGNKAATNGADGIWTEPFYAYSFAFPEMEITINGAPADDYGAQHTRDASTITYSTFYGSDSGEIIFRNPAGNGQKLLMIGESYDNAILKLLASHTSELYSVDLRNYEAQMGRPFDLVSYLEAHGIDHVVLVGNIDYFRSDSFDMEVVK